MQGTMTSIRIVISSKRMGGYRSGSSMQLCMHIMHFCGSKMEMLFLKAGFGGGAPKAQ